MKYSDIGLRVLAAKECGIVKTNAQFWGTFADREKFNKVVLNDDRVIKTLEKYQANSIQQIAQKESYVLMMMIFHLLTERLKTMGINHIYYFIGVTYHYLMI